MFRKFLIFTAFFSVCYSDRKGTFENCNVYSSEDLQRFDPSKCSSIRLTGIFPDVDGHLRFKGLSRNATVGK